MTIQTEAKLLYRCDALTRYTVSVSGKAYEVTTYPNSDLIWVELPATRPGRFGRPVSKTVGVKLFPAIRAAITALTPPTSYPEASAS